MASTRRVCTGPATSWTVEVCIRDVTCVLLLDCLVEVYIPVSPGSCSTSCLVAGVHPCVTCGCKPQLDCLVEVCIHWCHLDTHLLLDSLVEQCIHWCHLWIHCSTRLSVAGPQVTPWSTPVVLLLAGPVDTGDASPQQTPSSRTTGDTGMYYLSCQLAAVYHPVTPGMHCSTSSLIEVCIHWCHLRCTAQLDCLLSSASTGVTCDALLN